MPFKLGVFDRMYHEWHVQKDLYVMEPTLACYLLEMLFARNLAAGKGSWRVPKRLIEVFRCCFEHLFDFFRV
jgi:hypothetical protein